MKKLRYLNLADALYMHQAILLHSGGLQGVKNEGLVESALELIRNDDYYFTFEAKLTHLMFSIIKNHAFNDGNKRTSISLGGLFLIVNGYDYCLKIFIQVMEDVVVAVAENAVDKAKLEHIITEIIAFYPRCDFYPHGKSNA